MAAPAQMTRARRSPTTGTKQGCRPDDAVVKTMSLCEGNGGGEPLEETKLAGKR
jgi:hypothetical protein